MKCTALLAALVLASGFTTSTWAADATPPAAPPTDVVVLDHGQVDNAFAKGLPLLITNRYKIQASRRLVGGEVEFHEHDTDLLYFLEGEATLVTGGQMVEPRKTVAGEIRAKEITGGVTRHIVKGDIVVIPAGVPHWFKDVKAPCVYHVVKVTQ